MAIMLFTIAGVEVVAGVWARHCFDCPDATRGPNRSHQGRLGHLRGPALDSAAHPRLCPMSARSSTILRQPSTPCFVKERRSDNGAPRVDRTPCIAKSRRMCMTHQGNPGFVRRSHPDGEVSPAAPGPLADIPTSRGGTSGLERSALPDLPVDGSAARGSVPPRSPRHHRDNGRRGGVQKISPASPTVGGVR